MRIAPAGLAVLVEDTPSLPPTQLQLFAFPAEIDPRGQATVSVRVEVPACKSVCLGLPTTEGGGRLFPPPGVDVAPGASIALPKGSSAVFQSITYVAPAHEGSEVVSAACYAAEALDCSQSQAPESVLATTTTRIVIRKPTPESNDAGGTSGTAGAAPAAGGSSGDASGGTAGAATGGTAGESSGGASGAPGSSGGAPGEP